MANITKKPNGTFLIRVSNGMKNGKQDLVSTIYKPPVGSTPAMAKKAAEKYAVLFEELVHSGGYEKKQAVSKELRARRRMTIEQFVQDHYYPSIQKHLSPTTCRTYELIIDSLILPSFGRVELEDVDSTHIQSFVDFLSTPEASAKGEQGLSPASVKRYSTVFSSIITEAWKQKFIETNPIGKNYIHYPKIVQPQLEAYSDDEVEQLMEALENEDIRTRALLTLAVTTGMRRGELVGLMWDDIDFDKQIITISRSVYKPKGEKQRIKSTKSVSSNRTVYIPDSCSRVLYELKIQQASDKRHSQGLWVDTGFVFTDKYGKNMSLYAPTRICAEVQAKYGLRHLKLHGLRHTCGSLMVEHGVDPETVKTVLGHESLKTTNRYLHPYAESMKEASEKMERIIRGKTDGEIEIHLSSGA